MMYYLCTIFLLISVIHAEDGTIATRIVNGVPVRPGNLTYMVSISVGGQHTCGGSLVGPRHVLTAAHCLRSERGPLPPSLLRVTVGSTRLRPLPQGMVLGVARYFFYDRVYNEHMHDIAILELNRTLSLSNQSSVSVIPLRRSPVEEGTVCTVAGWGDRIYNGNVSSNELLAVNVTVLGRARCSALYGVGNFSVAADVVCAGDDRGDACQGDSGGPLACQGHLAGLVSSGYECAHRHFPGLYTNVTRYATWIDSFLRHNTTTSLPLITPPPPLHRPGPGPSYGPSPGAAVGVGHGHGPKNNAVVAQLLKAPLVFLSLMIHNYFI